MNQALIFKDRISSESTDHCLMINGIDHAFMREFGCPCKRCISNRKSANTSVSLIGLDKATGKTKYHILFDVGMGVVNSLVNNPFLSGDNARLDWLFLSHWHPDHVLDLNRLCETWKRTTKRRGEKWNPIPVWVRKGSAEWLKRIYNYEWTNFLNPQISEESLPPGRKLDAIKFDFTDLTVIPITVSHCTADIDPIDFEENFYCSASFVIEIKNKKVVLLWDIDNRNNWIMEPKLEEIETVELLKEPDFLFIDCNTWSIEVFNGKNTGHTSFATVQEYVKVLSPKKTFLVHLSGHEDGQGNPGWGWDDIDWEVNAQKIWQERNLPGSVYIPRVGETIIL